MSLFLSRDEVAELTGRKQRQLQVEQLIRMKIIFTCDAFGWPKVLHKALESELGISNRREDDSPRTINYKNLNEHLRHK